MARRFVGLDIGHHTVRAVALRRSGHTVAITEHAALPRLDEDGTPRPLRAIVAEIAKLVPLGASPTISIGDLNTLVRYVGTIPLPPDRLQRSLRLELEQALEASELAADSFPVPLASDELIHCCILTHPSQALEALGDLRAAGVTDPELHVAPAAVYNATVPLPPVKEEELALMVDIGSAHTNVALFGDRRLLACRQLSLGGDDFTRALGEGASADSAEKRKLAGEGSAVMVAPGLTEKAAAPTQDSSRLDIVEDASKANDPTGGLQLDEDHHDEPLVVELDKETAAASGTALPFDAMESVHVTAPGSATQQIATRMLGPELTKVAESLYGQLASSLAWFRTQIHARQLTITKIVLSGGGAGLDGLDAYLQRRFNLPVVRFSAGDGIEGNLPSDMHAYATAIGLAVANANFIPGTIRLDLTPDSLQRRRLWRTRLIWPYVAAAALVLSTVLACWTMLNNQAIAEANLQAYNDFKKEYDDLKQQLDDLQRERDGLSEDLRAIAGRIYAGRDLLYTVRALKEQTDTSKELWVTSLETVDIGKDNDVTNSSNSTTRSLLNRPNNNKPTTGTRRDTAIDRGGVVVAGLVKFDDEKKDVELNSFFEQYKAALDNWKPSESESKLFRSSEVLIHLISHDDVKTTVRTTGTRHGVRGVQSQSPEVITEEGRFPFAIRFDFEPTELGEITKNAASPKVTVKP